MYAGWIASLGLCAGALRFRATQRRDRCHWSVEWRGIWVGFDHHALGTHSGRFAESPVEQLHPHTSAKHCRFYEQLQQVCFVAPAPLSAVGSQVRSNLNFGKGRAKPRRSRSAKGGLVRRSKALFNHLVGAGE